MIFLSAMMATIAAVICLAFTPLNGILVTLMLKPIIDASWNDLFLGINCLQIIGVAVPLFILSRIIGAKNTRFFEMPLSVIGTVFLISNLYGLIGIITEGFLLGATGYFFRLLNGYLGLFMFQFYFNDREKFQKLLFFLLLAGLFPMLTGIYQAITGEIWQFRHTSFGLVRYVGFYHDAFNVRAYGFQTLTAILLSWTYFSTTNPFKKILLAVYGIACCFVIFKIYSKAAIATFIIWIILWSMFNKKMIWLVIIPIGVLTINYASENKVFQDVERVFRKEIAAYEGTMDQKYILAGRTIGWKQAWEEWKEKDMFDKFLGTGTNPSLHNEFLRILYQNGMLGLIVFVSMVIIIGWKLWINMLSRATPLNAMSIMIYAMWLVDTIGLHPGMYPAYQWYVWGFVGLALRGVKGLDESNGGTAPTRALTPARPISAW